MTEQDVYALRVRGPPLRRGHYDGLVKGFVELALERPDIGAEFRRYLSGLDLS